MLLIIPRLLYAPKYTSIDTSDRLTRCTDEIQLLERDYRALPRLSKRNYNAVLNYLYYGADLHANDEEFFLHPREAVSLAAGTQNSWLDDTIEKMLNQIPGSQVFEAFNYMDVLLH
jgi:hypothetical protein